MMPFLMGYPPSESHSVFITISGLESVEDTGQTGVVIRCNKKQSRVNPGNNQGIITQNRTGIQEIRSCLPKHQIIKR